MPNSSVICMGNPDKPGMFRAITAMLPHAAWSIAFHVKWNLFLDEFAGGLFEGCIDFIAWQCLDDVVVVPRLFGFGWLLDLHEVHVVDHAAIFAYIAVLGEEVVDLVGFHPFHQGIAIISTTGLDALQIEVDGGIVARLQE